MAQVRNDKKKIVSL